MTEAAGKLADLEASIRRYLEAGRAAKPGRGRDSRARWSEFADLGWVGAAVPENLGGYGGAEEMALIAREFGAGLVCDPYIEAGVVPTVFLSRIAPLPQHADLLTEVMSGGARVCAALGSDHRFPGTHVESTDITRGLKLSGSVGLVHGAGDADFLLVPVRRASGATVIVLIACTGSGVHREALPSIDGSEIAFVALNDVVVPSGSVFSEGVETLQAFQLAVDSGLVAQSSQMIGVMDRAFQLTCSHLTSRRQFGQPLAAFQALRHRLADMYAELEQARALLTATVTALGSKLPVARSRLASACKVRSIRAARFVGAQAVQLHGAVALTEEYEVGRCFTRLLALEKTWGDLEFHARRFVKFAFTEG